jgi:hypothetical protein
MFHRYLLNAIPRAPDPAPEPAPTPEPAPVATAPVPEPAPTPEPEPTPAPVESSKTPWFVTKIAEESARAQEALTKVAAAERRAAEAEALAKRLQDAPKAGEQPQHTPTAPAPQPPAQADFDSAVQRAAAAQRMVETRNEIIRNGNAAFGGAAFNNSANILAAMGCATDDFISDVVAIDRNNAHKLLSDIAANPENAARLAQLDSRSRIAELARMTAAPAPVATAPVKPAVVASRAPAPAPAIQPSTSVTKDWRSDEASDEEFHNGWLETMAKRRGNRR